MNGVKKSDLECLICNKILNEPIYLPCCCTICHMHLKDDSVKYGLIECGKCSKDFLVAEINITTNKFIKNYLDTEEHLSTEEKELKLQILDLIDKIQELYVDFIKNSQKAELDFYYELSELKVQILAKSKDKKDEIVLNLIKKVMEKEEYFYGMLKEIMKFDLGNEREKLDDLFRNVDLTIEQIKQFKLDIENGINRLKSKIHSLKPFKNSVKKHKFEVFEDIDKLAFDSDFGMHANEFKQRRTKTTYPESEPNLKEFFEI